MCFRKSNTIFKADASGIYVIDKGGLLQLIYRIWNYSTTVSSHRCTTYLDNDIRVPAV